MKKALIFAVAMALGIAASAYATSPLGGVSTNHWAYDSMEKFGLPAWKKWSWQLTDGYAQYVEGKLQLPTDLAPVFAPETIRVPTIGYQTGKNGVSSKINSSALCARNNERTLLTSKQQAEACHRPPFGGLFHLVGTAIMLTIKNIDKY